MSCSEEKLTLEKLVERISIYKNTKSNRSCSSIGMTFETLSNIYYFDTGTGKIFKIDLAIKMFIVK